MDTELWATIRRLYEVEHLSKSAISQKLGIHRVTVRRALCSTNGPPADQRQRISKQGKLDSHKRYMDDRLKEYPELSAAKLFIEIKKLGYTGGYTIVKDHLRVIRPGKPNIFLRMETLPGEFAQVDWANVGSIVIGNCRRLVSCFVMVLSYSRMIYIEFTLSQRLEDFLQCHVNAFHFFGGVTKKINYDNLKSVVLYRLGRETKFNAKFVDFSGYYLFEPVLCNVRKPNEKGKVESGVKYVRSAFLAGYPLLQLSQIKKDGDRWRDEEANLRIHGTTRERPIDRFQSEKTQLLALAPCDYDCSIVETVHATSQALAHFESNRYSVPYSYGRKTLTLKATSQTVFIYQGTQLLATHPRCYEKYQVIEKPEHYQRLLAERKKAKQSKLMESFLSIAPECAVYLQGLFESEINLPNHLEKIRECVHLYGKEAVIESLRHALRFNAFGAHYIQNIILQKRALKNMAQPQPIVLTKKPQWTQLTVEQTDLALYDHIFEPRKPEDSSHE